MSQISIFATGNGDSILIEHGDIAILTDINYRSGADDDEQDDKPDFAEEIRDACRSHRLNLLVNTHPDIDHVRGAEKLFHLGPPGDWDDDPEDGEPLILIEEIWTSPHGPLAYVGGATEKPLIDEIKRRKRLMGTAEGELDGNRLVIRSCDDDVTSGNFFGATWTVLAPTQSEADIPSDNTVSSNVTSLCLQWEVLGTKILLLGDTTVEVLERIYDTVEKESPAALEWHILVAPHHCSRRCLGYIDDYNVDAEFEESEKALTALSNQIESGYVVASSRKFKRAGSPPSSYARNRYYRILGRCEKLADVTQADKDRFLVAGGAGEEDPAHIVFELTRAGPGQRGTRRRRSVAVVSSSSAGGSYG